MVLAGVKNPASLIYVYAFFIDNIATAFAACALYEVFPISTTAIFSFSTLVWLVSYDLLVTAFCLTITWAAFSYWARVRAQNAGNARRALKREHFCKLLAFSSTVVMATAHKSITLFGWQGIELVVNARLHYEPAAHDELDGRPATAGVPGHLELLLRHEIATATMRAEGACFILEQARPRAASGVRGNAAPFHLCSHLKRRPKRPVSKQREQAQRVLQRARHLLQELGRRDHLLCGAAVGRRERDARVQRQLVAQL